MKKIIPILSILLALFSCSKDKNTTESVIMDEFYENGAHVTVFQGTPLDTRAQGEGYNSYTVQGEKNGKTLVLYAIDTYTDRDFITEETFLTEGIKLFTTIIYHGRVASCVVNPDLHELLYDYSPETRAGGRLQEAWEQYKACIEEQAAFHEEMASDTAFERMVCDWFPCSTAIYVISAFECL